MLGSSTASRLIAGGLGVVAVVGGMQLAAASGGSKIHGCEAKSNGALRIAKHCTKHEKSISWNKQGPAGKRGKPGTTGTLDGFSEGPTTSATSVTGDNAYHTVVSVDVPAQAAGNYIVTATTEISSTAATGSPLGNCVVADSTGPLTPVAAWEVPTTSDVITTYPTLTSELVVPSGGDTINYQCKSGANVTAETASISLVQVTILDH
jgi:hypothetical protein